MTQERWIETARKVLSRWIELGERRFSLQVYSLTVLTTDLLATRLLFDTPSPDPVPYTYIEFVFDGPPSPEGPRFIEVNDAGGRSIRIGEWSERPDGLWSLRIPDYRLIPAQRLPSSIPTCNCGSGAAVPCPIHEA